MKPIDFIVLGIVALIITAIVMYIRKKKKKGMMCIGCPDSGKCAGKCTGCPGSCSACGRIN